MSSDNKYNTIFGFMVEHGHNIKKEDAPLIYNAILSNSKDFLDPPQIIKELAEGTDDPYTILANYALNKLNRQITPVNTDFDLCI